MGSFFKTTVLISIVFVLTSFTRIDKPESKLITGGELSFTVRTVTQNGTYAPKHVLAIWIEDADGFVKTRKAMANQRKQYLYTWKAASDYNVVDAITGPTLNSHQTHTVTWDCVDLDGNIVPNGDYTVWVEFTEKHAQGPLYTLTFTKGPDAQSITPPDQTYFKDIQLDYVPLIADFSANVNDICQGESVIFTDLSVNAENWQWNFGAGASPATAVTAGPHTVTYSTPGTKTISLTINEILTETKQNMITVNPVPTAEFSFSGDGFTIVFTNASSNATAFLWNFGDGNTSTESNPVHTYLAAGTYSVGLTANYLICTDMVFHDVSLPMTSINKNQSETEQIMFYPNPVKNKIYVDINQKLIGNSSVTLYNSSGIRVKNTTIKETEKIEGQIMDISDIPEGIYLIEFKNSSFIKLQKIIHN